MREITAYMFLLNIFMSMAFVLVGMYKLEKHDVCKAEDEETINKNADIHEKYFKGKFKIFIYVFYFAMVGVFIDTFFIFEK
jgi:hypothetical protein